MDMSRPTGWRKGQTIFNFLRWLKLEKKFPGETCLSGDKGDLVECSNTRMADPYHVEDERFDDLYQEFLLWTARRKEY